ncbi:MAG TPA: hypothetical protein VHS59_10020, partial [Bacillota bacterium]|nr:hypothetical protein [Bacillota bacterium]
LEEMKYKAPINLTREVLNKFKQVEGLSSNYAKEVQRGKQSATRGTGTSGTKVSRAQASGTQAPLKKASGTRASGSRSSGANQSGSPNPESPQIEFPEEESLLRQIRDYTKKSGDKVGSNQPTLSRERLDSHRAEANSAQLDKLFKLAGPGPSLENLRDELFINEYVLTRFPNYSMGRTNLMDGEYVLCGGAPGTNLKAQVIARLYPLRMALDTMAYLAFSKAPVEPLSRLIYSLSMGALQATLDVYRLLDGKTVTIAAMQPGNPLDKSQGLQLNYRDHLRLLLLLDSGREQEKLDRIATLIKFRNTLDLGTVNTAVQGQATISIKLWFLSLGGLGNLQQGPFGTRVRGGRCYITKAVEYSY